VLGNANVSITKNDHERERLGVQQTCAAIQLQTGISISLPPAKGHTVVAAAGASEPEGGCHSPAFLCFLHLTLSDAGADEGTLFESLALKVQNSIALFLLKLNFFREVHGPARTFDIGGLPAWCVSGAWNTLDGRRDIRLV
jgi:hypothetical protein